MVTIELPPEVETAPATEATAEPTAARRGQRPPLSARRGWRRDVVVKLLVNPTPVAETAELLEQQTGRHPRRLPAPERLARLDHRRPSPPSSSGSTAPSGSSASCATSPPTAPSTSGKTTRRSRSRPWPSSSARSRRRRVARLRADARRGRLVAAALAAPGPGRAAAWTDEQRTLAARLVGGDPTRSTRRDAGLRRRAGSPTWKRPRARGRGRRDRPRAGGGGPQRRRVPGLARLRRYARSLHRQLKWYVDQFHVEHPDRWDDPRRRPAIYGPAVEEFRAPDPNRFEGKPTPLYPVITPPDPAATTAPANGRTKPAEPDPAPAIEKTKPPGSNLEHEFKKAKPFDVSPAPEIKKAKPFEWIKASRIEDDAPADACPGPGVNGRGGAAVPPETR